MDPIRKTQQGSNLISALKQRTPGQPGTPKAKTPPTPGPKQSAPYQPFNPGALTPKSKSPMPRPKPGMPKAKRPAGPGPVSKHGPDPRKASVYGTWR